MKNIKFAALAIVGALTLASCTTVSPQEVGLKVSKAGSARGVSNTSVVNGYVTYNPVTTTVVQYPRTVQGVTWKEGEQITFRSKGGLQVTAPVAFNFRVNPERAADIYVKYGRDLNVTLSRNLRQIVQDNLNRVGSQYTPNELVGAGSVAFEDKAEALIQTDFDKIGFILDSFSLPEGVHPPQVIVDSINASQKANQDAIRIQNELASTKAQAAKVVAQAEGAAQAKVLQAEAEAKSNRILAQSITPQLLELERIKTQRIYAEKSNGQGPLAVGGTSILDARQAAQAAVVATQTDEADTTK